ncbi:hypothetical protein [Photorhabdus sp. CRCIA-P01]|uniref:hypothetical protein n=1 Tax=Photorhabdus sp. CRCIA-P01 TaxID=2019570 RepID=UPI0013007D4C|nr:hypothetical protein [Photorhabdus sp. CRCIA-P01]
MPNYKELLTQESPEMRARVIEQAREHKNGGAFLPILTPDRLIDLSKPNIHQN